MGNTITGCLWHIVFVIVSYKGMMIEAYATSDTGRDV